MKTEPRKSIPEDLAAIASDIRKRRAAAAAAMEQQELFARQASEHRTALRELLKTFRRHAAELVLEGGRHDLEAWIDAETEGERDPRTPKVPV